MSLNIFLNDFCQSHDFFLLAFVSCHSYLALQKKWRVISFTVISLASTLRWSVTTSIFVIFCFFYFRKGKNAAQAAKKLRDVQYIMRKPYHPNHFFFYWLKRCFEPSKIRGRSPILEKKFVRVF